MVKYRMDLSDEKKEAAINIALESKGNVRKRKIAIPLLMVLGIVIIFSSIFLIINSPAVLWYVYMVIGIFSLFLAFNAKSFQKYYWTAFKEYGTMGQYIYAKRKDNKIVLVDKNDLSKDEIEELTQLLTNNITCES